MKSFWWLLIVCFAAAPLIGAAETPEGNNTFVLDSGIWSKDGCYWDVKELASITTKKAECGPACMEDSYCTHFDWSADEEGGTDGTCYLSAFEEAESDVLKEVAGHVCGYLDGYGGSESADRARADRYRDWARADRQRADTRRDVARSDRRRDRMRADRGRFDSVQQRRDSASEGSNTFVLDSGIWSKDGCYWDVVELESITTKKAECGPACMEHSECTHFDWSADEEGGTDGTCYLSAFGEAESDVLKEVAGHVCGYLDGYGGSESTDRARADRYRDWARADRQRADTRRDVARSDRRSDRIRADRGRFDSVQQRRDSVRIVRDTARADRRSGSIRSDRRADRGRFDSVGQRRDSLRYAGGRRKRA